MNDELIEIQKSWKITDKLLSTPLKSTEWKEAAETVLRSAFKPLGENDPRWFEYISHILNHPGIESAHWILLKEDPDILLSTIAPTLDAAVMLRGEVYQPSKQREKEQDFWEDERESAERKAKRALQIRRTLDEIAAELGLSAYGMLVVSTVELDESREWGRGNPLRHDKDIQNLLESEGWTKLLEHYDDDSIYEFESIPKLTRRRVMFSVYDEIKKMTCLEDKDLVKVVAYIMDAAVGDTAGGGWTPDRVYTELSPSRNRSK